MHILGFNCFAHDAAAAIVRDGELLGLVEEERFVGKKHTGAFPVHSLRWCCDIAGVRPAELDHVVFYWNPKLARLERLWHVLRYFPRSLELIRSRLDKENPMGSLGRLLREELGISERTRLHFAHHHLCHAASSFLTSPFDQAAILNMDAVGEWDCTWLGLGRDIDMTCLRKKSFPQSIGLVYGAVTEHLGYRFNSGEGKVMGLAPYGDPARYRNAFREMIELRPDGNYHVDLSYFAYQYRGRPHWFSQKFYRTFGPTCEHPNEPDQHAMDIAAALQERTEEVGLHLARWLHEQTGSTNLCLTGGVCLNSVMNGRILMETPFTEVSIQPAANDAGTAMGGCYWLWNSQLRQPRSYQFEHAYYGPWFEEAEIAAAIEAAVGANAPVMHEKVADAPAVAAQMLAQGKIIGWFQGRMEMGPRALGNRSILADPRSSTIKDLINARVKFREAFRPFAPSVLEEKSGEYFATDYPSPFMILVYQVRPEKRAAVPAITHVDGSARVQTVSQRHNPRYHRLISEFEKLTGVPMVLNTSFNVRGKPITHRPEEAIDYFLHTGMDALFIGDHLLRKPTDSAALQMSEATLRAAHAAATVADNAYD
jgi:carbamoyltransferase